jgi:hypothetical protein
MFQEDVEEHGLLGPVAAVPLLERMPGYTIEPLDVHDKDGLAVRFLNGKRFQITKKLADVVGVLDRPLPYDEVAARLRHLWQIDVESRDVEALVERFLKPYQLAEPVGSPPRQGPPPKTMAQRWREKLLLQDFFFKFKLIPQQVVVAIASKLTGLLRWSVALPILLGFTILNIFVYQKAFALRDAGQLGLTQASEYLAIVALTLLGVVVHEFGHAAAVVRFGGSPSEIGFGLYFIYPALYANVNESWRFRRSERVVVDLAGIYFQFFALGLFAGAFFLTGYLPFLYGTLIGEALAVYSLIPFFKFDGYWCLTDAFGVPNLRMRAFKELARTIALIIRKEPPRGLGDPPTLGRRIAFNIFAIASLSFFVFILVSLIKHSPDIFSAYPAFTSRTWEFVKPLFALGSWNEIGVVFIRWFMKTFVVLGLSLTLVSLAITLYDLVRRFTRRNADART